MRYELICLVLLQVMERDARKIREGGPTIFAQVKNGKGVCSFHFHYGDVCVTADMLSGVDHIVELILSAWRSCGASAVSEGANGV